MSLIFITGVSTSGKSTVANELSKRGYEAYDTEHNGISAWYNKKSGERAVGFGEMPERTEEWLSRHQWLISAGWVAKMAVKAKAKPVFLCGGSANEAEIRELCDVVIWLKTDETTIRRRVNIPRDHDYGTKPHELTHIIESYKQKEIEYTAYGAAMVDATKSIDEVIADLLCKSRLRT